MSAVEEGGKTCIFYIGFLHFDDGGIDGPSILKPLQKPQLRRLQSKRFPTPLTSLQGVSPEGEQGVQNCSSPPSDGRSEYVYNADFANLARSTQDRALQMSVSINNNPAPPLYILEYVEIC